jgi:hypothetical protein
MIVKVIQIIEMKDLSQIQILYILMLIVLIYWINIKRKVNEEYLDLYLKKVKEIMLVMWNIKNLEILISRFSVK